MDIKEQDLMQKKDFSNKAEEKSEIDKVIDMICALFATIQLKRIWKQHPLFLKFMVFLPNKIKRRMIYSSSHIRHPNSLLTSNY
jgi:mRNA-degrading endonuclease YafQ of YafQ-DinJ toxin-antitoxin module